ncbi:non-ribosomal peptide synthetase [Streptomyces yangpuensis]|uniref:non-ribosomal peptide synthetase n=1 Tax=Streptomyces yangpuensis TaxID=1648182 RepID=UPI003812D907
MSDPNAGPATDPGTLEAFAPSPEQRRAFALAEEGGRYGHRAVITVTGTADESALHRTITALAQRHEILRTRVSTPAGGHEPAQYIGDTGNSDIEWRLVPTGDNAWQLHLDLPATLADRATARLLVDELARNHSRPVEPADPQYADIAAWLEDVLATPRAQEVRRTMLRQVTPQLLTPRLPFESRRTRAAQETRTVVREVPAELARVLGQVGPDLADREDAVLLACWQALLGRLTASDGSHSPVVAVAVDGRRRPEMADALGPLTRYLPVPGAPLTGPVHELVLTAGKELAALAQDVHHFTWPHQPEPGWPGRALPHNPYAFAFERRPQHRASHDGVRFALHELEGRTERWTVELGCVRDGDRLLLELRHDPSALPAGYAGHLLDQYVALLAAACDQPSADVLWLPLSHPDAHPSLIAAGATDAAPTVTGGGVLNAFLDRVREQPDAIALVDGDRELSYAGLAAAVDALADRLAGQGVRNGAPVAVCLERGAEAVTAALAVLRAGGAYTPVDLANPPARREAMLRELAPRAVIDTPPAPAPDRRAADTGSTAGPGPFAEPHGDQIAYIIHTSGSTGTPKPVAVPHRALRTRLDWSHQIVPLGPADHVLMAAGLGFDFSLWEILAPLTAGATLVVADTATYQDPTLLARLLRGRRVTVAHFTPALLDLLVDVPDFAACADLRLVMSGGDVLDADTVRRFTAVTTAVLVNQYGPTEAAIDVTSWRLPSNADEAVDGPEDTVPIGRPAPGCTVRVLDARLLPAPVGVPGEMYIGGDTLARGYLALPSATASRFVADPYRDGARMYRTGDLGRLRWDGAIEFLGRSDDEISLRGYRIHLADVETALREHPAVAACAVAPVTTGRTIRLVGHYVPADTDAAPPGPAELRAFLAERLPDHMHPELFVPQTSLPLTASGKVDRRALPEPGPHDGPRTPYRAPVTDVEKVLARLWLAQFAAGGRSELERVGLDDDFYQLGGHSLMSLGLLSAVRDALGVQVPLARLLRATTVAQLAEVIGECEPQPGHAAKVAKVWLRVSGISSDEAAALLAQRASHEGNAQ